MQQQRGKIPTPSINRPTVLIVDDQPDNLDLLVRILKKGGYNARPALNGQLALGAVAHTRPDLILLDIRMPEIDGFELCKRLKSDPHSHDIPVIFISALNETDEKVRAFQAGGVDYISRPFQYQEVLARVSTHLELAHMRNQMEALIQAHSTALDAKSRTLADEITTHQATAQQLRQSEKNYRVLVERQKDLANKMEATTTLIGGIAHDFQNVLETVNRNTEMIVNEAAEGSLSQECLNEITKATLRGREALKQLMKLGCPNTVERIQVNLDQHPKDASKAIESHID